MKKRWSIREDITLKEMYVKGNKTEITNQFNRSWDAIKLRAAKLGVKRWPGFYRNSNITPLLCEANEALYWIGFLLADGHFSAIGRITLTLAEKDLSHLQKFASYINTSNIRKSRSDKYPAWAVTAQDQDLIPLLIKKYDISNNKTYIPPDFSNYHLSSDNMFALFIGFFDGDGNIANRCDYGFFGRIKCHSNWNENLIFMRNQIDNWFSVNSMQIPHINKNGYTEWTISATILRKMKTKAASLNLPLLHRKWDKVLPSKPKIITPAILEYIRQSTEKTSELSKKLGLKYETIYNTRLRHGWPTVSS